MHEVTMQDKKQCEKCNNLAEEIVWIYGKPYFVCPECADKDIHYIEKVVFIRYTKLQPHVVTIGYF